MSSFDGRPAPTRYEWAGLLRLVTGLSDALTCHVTGLRNATVIDRTIRAVRVSGISPAPGTAGARAACVSRPGCGGG